MPMKEMLIVVVALAVGYFVAKRGWLDGVMP